MRGCPDCPRGLKTCVPLDNVIADEGAKSFVCVGLNDGSDRMVLGDYLTLCVRAGYGRWSDRRDPLPDDGDTWIIDERSHVDRLDLGDQASVISSALVMDERLEAEIRESRSENWENHFDKFKDLRRQYDEEDAEATDDSN